MFFIPLIKMETKRWMPKSFSMHLQPWYIIIGGCDTCSARFDNADLEIQGKTVGDEEIKRIIRKLDVNSDGVFNEVAAQLF